MIRYAEQSLVQIVTESPRLVAVEVALGLAHHEVMAAGEVAVGPPPDAGRALADSPVLAQVLDVGEVDSGLGAGLAGGCGGVAHIASVVVSDRSRTIDAMHLIKALADGLAAAAAMLGLMLVVAVTFALMLWLLSITVLT